MQLPETMLEIYTNILNGSLSTGIFPKELKKAIIKRIPKLYKVMIRVDNYRPISLLETTAKIYEMIINNRLKQHLHE